VDKIQVASGLQAGERVITEGADRLRDGSRVMLPGAPAPARDAPSAASAVPVAAPGDKPTAEQRQRMLDSAQGDAEQLERRKRFLEAIDRGDPQALERWRTLQQRRRDGAGASQ
jgi:multidrug efflux system membrane fusion protein